MHQNRKIGEFEEIEGVRSRDVIEPIFVVTPDIPVGHWLTDEDMKSPEGTLDRANGVIEGDEIDSEDTLRITNDESEMPGVREVPEGEVHVTKEDQEAGKWFKDDEV